MTQMSPSENYYRILSVHQYATEAEIRAAYRKLALKWHPDKNTKADTTEIFKSIVAAYETLSDASLRATYDEKHYLAVRPGRRKRRRSPSPSTPPPTMEQEREIIAQKARAYEARMRRAEETRKARERWRQTPQGKAAMKKQEDRNQRKKERMRVEEEERKAAIKKQEDLNQRKKEIRRVDEEKRMAAEGKAVKDTAAEDTECEESGNEVSVEDTECEDSGNEVSDDEEAIPRPQPRPQPHYGLWPRQQTSW